MAADEEEGNNSNNGSYCTNLKDAVMADLTHFKLMQVISKPMAKYIMDNGNCFTKDLVINGRDELVSSFGDTDRIREQMSDTKWLDDFKF
jgi:hypothetical protein